MDQDRLTFILRERDDAPNLPDVAFAFEPEFFDDMLDAFTEGYRVLVGGFIARGAEPVSLVFFRLAEGEPGPQQP